MKSPSRTGLPHALRPVQQSNSEIGLFGLRTSNNWYHPALPSSWSAQSIKCQKSLFVLVTNLFDQRRPDIQRLFLKLRSTSGASQWFARSLCILCPSPIISACMDLSTGPCNGHQGMSTVGGIQESSSSFGQCNVETVASIEERA